MQSSNWEDNWLEYFVFRIYNALIIRKKKDGQPQLKSRQEIYLDPSQKMVSEYSMSSKIKEYQFKL